MREKIITWLKSNVSEARLQHIIGVEQTAIKLAKQYQIDENKAAMAGIMHDLAKFFPPQKLLKIAKKHKINIDSICQHHPHLLHAQVSAIVAKLEFGMQDQDILKAIENHTLGSPEMNTLSCIVFVADTIEPTRGNDPELVKIRRTSQENLYKAVVETCDYSLKCLINSWQAIHHQTVMTRNWALDKSKSS